eukprot:UN30125
MGEDQDQNNEVSKNQSVENNEITENESDENNETTENESAKNIIEVQNSQISGNLGVENIISNIMGDENSSVLDENNEPNIDIRGDGELGNDFNENDEILGRVDGEQSLDVNNLSSSDEDNNETADIVQSNENNEIGEENENNEIGQENENDEMMDHIDSSSVEHSIINENLEVDQTVGGENSEKLIQEFDKDNVGEFEMDSPIVGDKIEGKELVGAEQKDEESITVEAIEDTKPEDIVDAQQTGEVHERMDKADI